VPERLAEIELPDEGLARHIIDMGGFDGRGYDPTMSEYLNGWRRGFQVGWQHGLCEGVRSEARLNAEEHDLIMLMGQQTVCLKEEVGNLTKQLEAAHEQNRLLSTKLHALMMSPRDAGERA